MFSKAEKTTARRTTSNAPPSIISANLKVLGNLETDGELHVDGEVDGDIAARKLTIGQTACVRGEVRADDVTIHGEVRGCVRAGRVALTKTARITGDIHHESLAIEAGATLDGHCRNSQKAAETKRIEAPQPSKPADGADRPAAQDDAGNGLAAKDSIAARI
ncbi:bactofilin family protein [Oceanibacterium hippocampi]|uniref:Polymer-forming cytoskeletal n=1 Tax=Oceanibacterium hippocampi TaxID=745714 RepID=A0A1Y5SXM8_9PROT|nr:polymer-forming cytoskeletal protein [Oceanibacterium hippocampi]SLN49222.1 Polymer-forming cytoskeletal [Oceanibacterium hippocampi]